MLHLLRVLRSRRRMSYEDYLRNSIDEDENEKEWEEDDRLFLPSESKPEKPSFSPCKGKIEGKEQEEHMFETTLFCPFDGPCKIYRYWDSAVRQKFDTVDKAAAKQASNGLCEEVWVMIKNGKIDHDLTPEEIRQYLP